jgi:hypothetical protein
MKPALAPLVLLFLSSTTALAAIGSAGEATAVYERIRTTPAEHALYCEQLKLQGESIRAFQKNDMASVSRVGQRISEIQAQLKDYKDALNFVSGKAGDMSFYKSPEGRALDKADKALAGSCG